jgi:hypothetical protein
VPVASLAAEGPEASVAMGFMQMVEMSQEKKAIMKTTKLIIRSDPQPVMGG